MDHESNYASRAGSVSSPASPSPSQAPATRRTKVSCFPCRTRKSKCDHARPCSSCVLRGTTNQCADPSGATASSSAAPPASGGSATATPTLKARSLPASASMPGLGELTRNHASDADRSQGPQSKKRKTDVAHVKLPDHALTGPSRLTIAADQEISDEMHRMKQTMARLEDLLSRRPTSVINNTVSSNPLSSPQVTYQLDLAQDCPGESDPPSVESRHRWHHLRSILPPLIDTHLMMHYVFVESDWLMTCLEPARFVARWRHAYQRQAISDVFAAQVLTVVGCSALFLSDNRQRTLQFNVPIRSLHTKLIKEAVRIVDSMPALRTGKSEAETGDMLELMLNISLYFRCIGKEPLMGRYTERAITCSLRAGFDNELRASWLRLTPQQVERRRVLMCEVAMSTKWLAFHCRKDIVNLRIQTFSIGQPHLRDVGQLPPLDAWPQSDDVARTAAAQASEAQRSTSNRFFAWRTKSEKERDITRTYVSVSASLTCELPPIVELVMKTEARLLQPEALARCTKEEMRSMARETRQILARLQEWYSTTLPNLGVGFDRIVNANITSADPVEAKALAGMLMLNHAIFYMTSITCRAWLLLSDRLQSLIDAEREDGPEYEENASLNQNFLANLKQRSINHVHHVHASWLPSTFLADMEAAAVENARRCIRSIAVIRTLQSHSSSQFYVGWVCHSFLQAAVNLAVPLVRSHHRQQFDPSLNRGRGADPHHANTVFASATTDELRRDIVTIFEAVSQLPDNVMARRTAKVFYRAIRLSGIDRPVPSTDYEEGEDEIEDAWEDEQNLGGQGQMQNAAEGLALLSAASASARTPSSTDGSGTTGTKWSSGSDGNSPANLTNLAWEATARGPAPQTMMDNQNHIPASHSHLVPYQDHSHPNTSINTFPGPQATAEESSAFVREPMWWEYSLPEAQPAQAGVNNPAKSKTGTTRQECGLADNSNTTCQTHNFLTSFSTLTLLSGNSLSMVGATIISLLQHSHCIPNSLLTQ